ncbi:MAG: FAD-dependent oxidoreductase [Candidatus Pacebacteria bacterium]|nr:FAD-dependent oxidoreductase [Candidatus Paceibacterota bacterium]
MPMKIVIVGGVAGGASAAARARRLDESAEIVMFERGEFISFANCGLPYHVGNVIPERSSLLVMTPAKFKARTEIDVRIQNEVTAINRDRKTVTVRDLRSDRTFEESYDKLILATGSSPIRPPIPGPDDPDVLPLWTIPDMDRVKSRVDEHAKRAVVVGGGFIGLEIAENLRERGLEVALVEMLPQVLPSLDAEMTQPLSDSIEDHGVRLLLNHKVSAIERPETETDVSSELTVSLDDGIKLTADFVMMSIGVRPNSGLGIEADLAVGELGGIKVNERMQTSDPDIYAVGDVVETRDLIRNTSAQIPLAGPANRQGRVAADNICGRDTAYRGALGTSVVKVFDLTAASSGATEKRLQQDGVEYEKIYLHPESHAGYYPGANPLAMKLLFNRDGAILGIQAVGRDGVDKRVDVIATAMRGNMSVQDLAELELAYAPPYGSAKDPVNFAGMIATNVLEEKTRVLHWDTLPENMYLLDVRQPEEFEAGHVPGAQLIPLGQLRHRLDEVPRDRGIAIYCKVGLRGYLAERILRHHGFDAYNVSGGWFTYQMFDRTPSGQPARQPKSASVTSSRPRHETAEAPAVKTGVPEGWKADRELNASGLACPGPIVQVRKTLDAMTPGERLHVIATDQGFSRDIESWCEATSNKLVEKTRSDNDIHALIEKSGGPAASTEMAPEGAAETSTSATLVVFSGDLDKVMAAFILATGFAAMGMKVSMFFTFWGLNVLRKDRGPAVKKDFLSRMFGFMMPRGARKLALSKMHMLGMGTGMMKHVMARKNVSSLPELITEAKAQGVEFIACDMAMNVMGIQRTELIDAVNDVAGVANFAALARKSGTVLFI